MSKEHPIIMTGESVIRILTCAKCGKISVSFPCEHCGSEDFCKTQTRRIVKPQPGDKFIYADIHPDYPDYHRWRTDKRHGHGLIHNVKYKYQVGDTLWVRETYACWSNEHDNIIYCDNPEYIQLGQQNKLLVDVARESQECSDLMECVGHWVKVPSIIMPKWVARIFLEITKIRVERVQDITDLGCKAEGLKRDVEGFIHQHFRSLWNSLNANCGYSWDKNPWVWVREFKRREQGKK